MKIEKIDINLLNSSEYNPRKDLKPEDIEYKKIKRSIEEFGYVDPLIINKDMTVIGGNQRIKVLKELDYKKIDCVLLDLDKTKEKALNIALNKIEGEWDLLKLKDLLQELDTGEIDMDITGFDYTDLEELMTQFYMPDESEKDDEVPDIPEEPISKLGDLYKLGKHRLLCGDATKIEDVKRLMDGNKEDMVFTDPPYEIDLDTDYSDISKNWKGQVPFAKSKRYKKIIGDNLEFNFKDFNWINCREQFWWGANYYIKDLPEGGSWFVWDKTAGHTQQVVGNEFELLWSKKKHKQEILIAKWSGVMGLQTRDVKERIHPTQKPLEVCIPILKKFSKENNIILDLFGGSGSTLIACEKLNRKCYMMEIDPHYIDVIIKRYENYTNKKAKLIEN